MAPARQQFRMSAGLADVADLLQDDVVGALYRRQAAGNDQCGAALHRALQSGMLTCSGILRQ